jgi:hypothetical protein
VLLQQAKLRDVALSRGDREAAVAIMAGRMGFYAVRPQQDAVEWHAIISAQQIKPFPRKSGKRCRLRMRSSRTLAARPICCRGSAALWWICTPHLGASVTAPPPPGLATEQSRN